MDDSDRAVPGRSASESVSPEQQRSFRSSLKHLLGINAVSATLSIGNDMLDHSALSFTQGMMEVTDAAMAVGLARSHQLDVQDRHRAASRWRQCLYGTHIGAAGVGVAESARLMHEGHQPTLTNIAVAGLVAVINAHYIRHSLKHRRGQAHRQVPDYAMAEEDPIEVVQDVHSKWPSAAVIHELNQKGTTAIAVTNLVEASGGIAGTALQFGWSQGSAWGALVSSLGVIGVMGNQIRIERAMMRTVRSSQ